MLKNKFIVTVGLLCFFIVNNGFAKSRLVETQWLASQLGKPNIVLLDMSDNMQYQRFHIPGAVHLPYQAINQRTRKGVSLSVGPSQIMRILGLVGVSRDSHVVVYDDTGGLHASRLVWELDKLGHQRVSMLNGGLVQWILEGRKVTAETVKPQATRYQADQLPAVTQLASIETLENKMHTLLDVRSREEYMGHPRQKRSGHIPGARWWNWDQAVDFENGFKQQKTEALLDSLKQLGITSKQQALVVYCQSGHRAARSYFTLRQLGFDNVKLYDASMAEYQQSHKPLTRGMNP
ncbi:MAG: sulfurtransferase [Thioalkalispiraceae bacterium]|jgi:thiosulfate/3-mercaptopyruvate sulfurtransferase